MSEFEAPTEFEAMVLRKLHERVDRITKGKTPTARLVGSIVISCSSLNFPVVFESEDPAQVAVAMKELLRKGFVKQFDDKGLSSFIPIGSDEIVEY